MWLQCDHATKHSILLSLKTQIVKTGNSHWIRLPRTLLGQIALGPDVEIMAMRDYLILRTLRRSRAGWVERFKQRAKRKLAKLSPEFSISNQWDKVEWDW
jgi:antitoxin component of MazEF toxin-antitoxin module